MTASFPQSSWSRRAVLVAAAAFVALAGSLVPAATAPAGAQGDEPGQVQVQPAGDNQVRVTVPLSGPLPPLDARPELRFQGNVLGAAVEYPGRLLATVTLPDGVTIGELQDGIEVWLGGRPLADVTIDVVPGGSTAAPVAPTVADPSEVEITVAVAATDPGARGPYTSTRISYDRAGFRVAGMPVPLEVVGEVIHPPDAPGQRPLVLFLHGRHTTCYDPGDASALLLEWPCSDGTLPIPSYQGYRDTAETLASQGFITVSISANAVNAQDNALPDFGMGARSALVRHHLGLLQRWSRGGNDPMAAILRDRVDWNRVILVGHSRGGEGVALAAVDAMAERASYRIGGLSLIGPTNFQRRVAPGVHTSVIHPYCDGDVADLQGQLFVDNARDLLTPGSDPALYSAAMVLGANHNYFNTEWTPGESVAPSWDDWFETTGTCSATSRGRLTPAEQRATGTVYIAALARLVGYDDQSALPFLDGTAVRAASAGRARVLTHAVGGEEQVLYRAGGPGRVVASRGTRATICVGYPPLVSSPITGASVCSEGDAFSLRYPHWVPMFGLETEPAPSALRVVYPSGGGLAFPVGVPDLSAADHIDIRFAVNGMQGDLRPVLALTLADGGRVDLPAAARILPRLPGASQRGFLAAFLLPKVWAQTLRFDLTGIDPARRTAVSRLALNLNGASGSGYVLDVTARRSAVQPAAWRTDLPRVDIESRTVTEGDRPRRVTIDLVLNRPAPQPVELWVQSVDPITGELDGRSVVVPAGRRRLALPTTIPGDDIHTGDRLIPIVVRARTNAAVGVATGGITVIEDEPAPEITVTPINLDVTEGESATWAVELSTPMWFDVVVYGVFTPPDAGPELTVGDLTEQQRRDSFVESVALDVPLSQSFGAVVVSIPAGSTTATLSMEVAADGVAEPVEYTRLEVRNSIDDLDAEPDIYTVSVRD